jgi:hypothetical protein
MPTSYLGCYAPNGDGAPVQKSEEYLKHARECRALAKQMEQGEHRDQLMKMAETWEVLAAERARTHRAAGGDPGANAAALAGETNGTPSLTR